MKIPGQLSAEINIQVISVVQEPELDTVTAKRPDVSWAELLKREKLLQLPAAHDALTAKLIERAGFPAYQVGGFALVGARYGRPDVDLEHFGEKNRAVQDVIDGCALPVLVDADNGYGDAKNVTRTVRGYEALGASAIFIEDQTSPKRCGHMAGKSVIPVQQMVSKIGAAVAARQNRNTFILARTDAIQPEGVESAIGRGKAYLAAGADGIYLEGPRSVEELEQVGRAFRGTPLATSVLERGGVTPWLSPAQFRKLGYSMILYPTSVLFGLARATERILTGLRHGRRLNPSSSVDMERFEEIVDLQKWAKIESRFPV
jgi:methylisocitrate lyase